MSPGIYTELYTVNQDSLSHKVVLKIKAYSSQNRPSPKTWSPLGLHTFSDDLLSNHFGNVFYSIEQILFANS